MSEPHQLVAPPALREVLSRLNPKLGRRGRMIHVRLRDGFASVGVVVTGISVPHDHSGETTVYGREVQTDEPVEIHFDQLNSRRVALLLYPERNELEVAS